MNTRPSHEEIVNTCIKIIHDFVPEMEGVELSEESTVNTDAAMDSMSMILVITKVESAFDVRIPNENWDKIQTLGDLADAVEANLPQTSVEAAE